jgi:proline iminopeptidase
MDQENRTMQITAQSPYIRLAFIVVMFLFGSGQANAQKLYRQTFGVATDPAVVFLHGGPGYNSASFELGAAKELAERGFYVIVYDRRGAGRSKVKKAKYTFDEAEKDLKKVMKKSKVKKADLIGHSFGGAVAIRFAEDYPEMVDDIVLVGAPLDYPGTFLTIRTACRRYYTAMRDTSNLKYIDMLDSMDTGLLDYAVYCFAHAMSCKLYQTEKPSTEAMSIYKDMMTDPQAKWVTVSKRNPVKGFYDAHRYITLDFTDELKELVKTVNVYGIYGAEDGLFDAASLLEISQIIGTDHFRKVSGSSHTVFIDQRGQFLDLMVELARK